MTSASTVDVSVVIPTRGRADMLREAIESVRRQDVDAVVETVVVYDHSDPDPSLATDSSTRPVRVMTNERKQGPSGGRNTGIEAARGRVVAFLDDDDVWVPQKLTRQLEALRRSKGHVVVSGITVLQDGARSSRYLPDRPLTRADLIRNRMQTAHQSTVIVDADFLRHQVGLFDEDVPHSYGEDFDWLLRAASLSDVAVVPEPLVDVRWHAASWFFDRWAVIVQALHYLIDKHPDLLADRRGAANLLGRIAFCEAALGHRRAALRAAMSTVRQRPGEARWVLALPVVLAPSLAMPIMRTVRRVSGRSI